MPASYVTNFFIGFRKSAMTIAIIILVLDPKTIRRETLTTKITGFESNVPQIRFQARHLFCALPRSSFDINKSEILANLNLPNGTVIDEELERFGICLSEIRLNQTVDSCSCKTRPAYIILLIGAVISLLFDFCKFCLISVTEKYTSDLEAEGKGACFSWLAVDFLQWFTIACVSLWYHVSWFDTVWLPDSAYGQNYFARPFEWTLAVILAFVCSLCCFYEFLIGLERRERLATIPQVLDYMKKNQNSSPIRKYPTENGKEDEEDTLLLLSDYATTPDSKDSNADTWSIESYTERIKDRMENWHIKLSNRRQTYP